jgi:hypothetical protein
MNPITQFPLRKIAENTLAHHLGDLDDAARSDLAISLVRQWATNDGHAGIVTPTHRFWFRAALQGDGTLDVGFSAIQGNLGEVLVKDWQVDAAEMPELFHQLNLCQFARCRNLANRMIQVRIEPKERRVLFDAEPADAGATEP